MDEYIKEVEIGNIEGDWRNVENEKWFREWRKDCDFKIFRLFFNNHGTRRGKCSHCVGFDMKAKYFTICGTDNNPRKQYIDSHHQSHHKDKSQNQRTLKRRDLKRNSSQLNNSQETPVVAITEMLQTLARHGLHIAPDQSSFSPIENPTEFIKVLPTYYIDENIPF